MASLLPLTLETPAIYVKQILTEKLHHVFTFSFIILLCGASTIQVPVNVWWLICYYI